MSATSIAGREYCSTCGWPLGGARCEACGGGSAPLKLAEPAEKFAYDPATLDARFDRALEAFEAGDYGRMVSFCLSAEPTWTSRSVTLREGPAWILTVGDALVFMSIDASAGYLVIESPLVRLPERHRVAALRYVLEISNSSDSVSRVCLRGDLLVLRFAGHLSSVSPSVLFTTVTRSAAMSEQALAELVTRFDATPAIAQDQPGLPNWDALGKTRSIAHLAPPIAPRSAPPPPAPDEPSRARHDSIPDILSPSFVKPSDAVEDSIPDILSPSFVKPSDAVEDSIPDILSPSFVSGAASSGRGSGAQPAATAPEPRSRPTLNGLRIEAPRRGALTPPPMPAVSPEADRLCELLRRAQSLATALSFEKKPATMLLLVRAVVFRAVFSHLETSPDAVAKLYRGADVAVKEIWPSSSPKISPAQIPMAEPALLVMEGIVSMNAHVPKEPAVALEPLNSAAQAKEHLSRYLTEIERAPTDPELRHFLALGALAELLVRTKLPPQTQQRLREIVVYAHREDKRPESIELMMTALGRIVAP